MIAEGNSRQPTPPNSYDISRICMVNRSSFPNSSSITSSKGTLLSHLQKTCFGAFLRVKKFEAELTHLVLAKRVIRPVDFKHLATNNLIASLCTTFMAAARRRRPAPARSPGPGGEPSEGRVGAGNRPGTRLRAAVHRDWPPAGANFNHSSESYHDHGIITVTLAPSSLTQPASRTPPCSGSLASSS
jgi:hypothetical protein